MVHFRPLPSQLVQQLDVGNEPVASGQSRPTLHRSTVSLETPSARRESSLRETDRHERRVGRAAGSARQASIFRMSQSKPTI